MWYTVTALAEGGRPLDAVEKQISRAVVVALIVTKREGVRLSRPTPADMGSVVFCASGCLNENKTLNKRSIVMRASTSAKSSSGRRGGDKESKTPPKRSSGQKEKDTQDESASHRLPDKVIPFFFGRLSLGNDQHGHKYFLVTDVKSVVEGYKDAAIDLAWERQPTSVLDGDFVIGLEAYSGPIIFFNDDKKYVVQLLPWREFKESESEQSLEKYLLQHKVGELSAKFAGDGDIDLIGNENVPGHIIISDGTIYVKGFFSYGGGVVQYSNVFKYNGDFMSEVAERNQATDMIYHGTDFTILVPPKWSSVNRHSVMDCEGWVPLAERNESEEAKPRDASKGEDMKTDSSVSGQLTNIENIISAQGGEEMEDAGGAPDLKSDQDEEEESDSRPAPAKPTISLPVSREISIRGAVVVKDLALKLGVRPNRLVADLMHLKIDASVNQRIEPEAAIKVAQKYGYKVNVEYARDAVNKKPVQKSIDADDEIPQDNPENIRSRLVSTSAGETGDDVVASPTSLTKDNPTYSFGPNVGGEKMAATQALKNEQNQTEGVSPQIDDSKQPEGSCDHDWDAEMKFLSDFDKYVKACGFKYEPADLVRLHTSVKCSMCTLLAGNPGTGKSSLAELYMRAVAGSPEKNDAERSWRQIFVNPAWMEPADLLGYETDNGFRHGSSRLAEFIRNISKCENPPMGIVCFEEMNLACVEHYFSDFIQIISRGAGMIPGCKEDGRDLWVGRNFRVIGTCNSDETTRPLSPRFLSRCNTIELSNSSKTTTSLVTDLANGKTPEIKPFIGNVPRTYADFKHWYVLPNACKIDGIIISAILSLIEPKDRDESIMSSAGFDMSGRVVSDLFAYIRNRPPYSGEESDKGEEVRRSELKRQKVALDEFLAQRVFFACRPTPGTITAISTLRNTIDKGLEIKVSGEASAKSATTKTVTKESKLESSGKGVQNVSTDLLQLPLSAALLKRRIDDYNKRIMQV